MLSVVVLCPILLCFPPRKKITSLIKSPFITCRLSFVTKRIIWLAHTAAIIAYDFLPLLHTGLLIRQNGHSWTTTSKRKQTPAVRCTRDNLKPVRTEYLDHDPVFCSTQGSLTIQTMYKNTRWEPTRQQSLQYQLVSRAASHAALTCQSN